MFLRRFPARNITVKFCSSAIRLYGRAVRLVPDNPTYLLNRAAALIMVERYEDAIRDSMEATRTFQNVLNCVKFQPDVLNH